MFLLIRGLGTVWVRKRIISPAPSTFWTDVFAGSRALRGDCSTPCGMVGNICNSSFEHGRSGRHTSRSAKRLERLPISRRVSGRYRPYPGMNDCNRFGRRTLPRRPHRIPGRHNRSAQDGGPPLTERWLCLCRTFDGIPGDKSGHRIACPQKPSRNMRMSRQRNRPVSFPTPYPLAKDRLGISLGTALHFCYGIPGTTAAMIAAILRATARQRLTTPCTTCPFYRMGARFGPARLPLHPCRTLGTNPLQSRTNHLFRSVVGV